MIRLFMLLSALAFAIPALANGVWPAAPDFQGGKKDISGATCGPDACIAVNDETHRVQIFALKDGQITPGPRIDLLDDKAEVDAEAITHANGAFYITGSHGLSRKSGTYRPAQFLVFRLMGQKIERSDRLRDAIRRAPFISTYAEKRLSKNGANIEGMAAQSGRLFFGFRGPSIRNQAFVMEVAESAIFGTEISQPITHILPLGPRLGIRDMALVSDGILVLTGPVNSLPRTYSIVLWTPECGISRTLLEVPRPEGGKPEGLLLIAESKMAYKALIFSDGLKNGAPTEHSIPKPSRRGQ